MVMLRLFQVLSLLLSLVVFCSCDLNNEVTTSEIDPSGHMYRQDYLDLRERGQPDMPAGDEGFPPIPEASTELTPPPAPLPVGSTKRVSITVTDSMTLRDVLIELARESGVNLELDPRIQGSIIFTAHNQPFNEVLQRICSMAGLRTVVDGNFVRIELDEPYQQTYQLDFLSLSRRASSETSIATNVFDVNVANNGAAGNGGGSTSSSATENNSTSKVSASSEADLWTEVGRSIAQILNSSAHVEKDKATANYSIDKQAGLVTVYGDSRQQANIDDYFKKLRRKATAQVLIDARIIEVELNDSYKAGIDWATLFHRGLNVGAAFVPAGGFSPTNVFSASINATNFSGLLNLVRTFGTTRVLSSPRLTVLNNETAVLKVATNQVYFVTQAQFTTVTNANGSAVTTTPVYTSTPHTVPVGLVMTVQPAIDMDHNRVTMTLRPTISRVVGEVSDPSIGLNAAAAGTGTAVQSQIPVLAVREMDSVIRLHSGEVAVMGGLMQDSSINQDQGVPPFDAMPLIGTIAKSRNNEGTTTELVILLRATIADAPQADDADSDLYEHFGRDPRPLMTRHATKKPMPLPKPPKTTSDDDDDTVSDDDHDLKLPPTQKQPARRL